MKAASLATMFFVATAVCLWAALSMYAGRMFAQVFALAVVAMLGWTFVYFARAALPM